MSRHGDVGRAEHRAALDRAEDFLAGHLGRLSFERASGRGAEARGEIDLERPDGTLEAIEVRIHFGSWFPQSVPTVFDDAGRWEPNDDRHIPEDHSFCLYLRDVNEPIVTTTRGLEAWFLDLVVFLHQQLVYESTGCRRFPGPEWAHGQSAYAQYVVEILSTFPNEARAVVWDVALPGNIERNALCPCGAQRKTKRCHLAELEELRRIALRARLGERNLKEIEELCGL